jgi:hypothetical protein
MDPMPVLPARGRRGFVAAAASNHAAARRQFRCGMRSLRFDGRAHFLLPRKLEVALGDRVKFDILWWPSP